MPFTKDEEQKMQFQRLKYELSRLNSQFEDQQKTLGLKPEDLVQEKVVAPELATKLIEAQEEALRAGAARAAQCAASVDPGAQTTGIHRKGAIRL